MENNTKEYEKVIEIIEIESDSLNDFEALAMCCEDEIDF